MCLQCPRDVPAVPPLVLMQQHLCLPGPGPATLPGSGAAAGGWMTPPAHTGRAATASWDFPERWTGLSLPGSTGAGTQGAIWESGETETQVFHSLCPTPEEVDWDSEVWLLFPATRFSPLFTKKTSSKEMSAQGPGFFTEPFTITRASILDQSLSAGMQNACFFPHPM